MNQGRFQSIFNGLPQNMKKVYEVVPIKDAWGESFIMAELSRLGFSYSFDKPIIGILNRLKDLGLVKELESGKFQRIAVTAKVTKQEPVNQLQPQKIEEIMVTKTQQSPIAQLNDLAMQAIQIANLCKKLASDIETAAINIDDHVAFTSKDSIKLKQLQDLLKG